MRFNVSRWHTGPLNSRRIERELTVYVTGSLARRLVGSNKLSFRDWLQHLFGGGATSRSSGFPPEAVSANPEVDPYNPFPDIVEIEITDILDLHTIPPRDVARVVEEYLEQVQRAGFRSVRIIHGKGIGVQRETVRSILARTPFVSEWTDAPPQAGGLGATIVRLKSAGF